jgi:hypothetical protein
MENSERYETLSPTEIGALRKKSRKYAIGPIIMAVAVGLAAGGIWHPSWFGLIAIFLGALLVISFITRGQLRSVLSLNRDIREGKKKIIIDRMESQRQDIQSTGNMRGDGPVEQLIALTDPSVLSSTSGPSMSYGYLLKVRGKEFNVSELQYYQCQPGQMIEIHLAPHSEYVFYVNILKDAATERATL